MNQLRTLLDSLEDRRLDYVMARSLVNNDKQGYENAGISKAAFYLWPSEEREQLNDIAQRLKRENAVKALMVIQNASEQAAQVKVDGLKSRNEHVKQDVATEILDRTIGKTILPIDVTSKGESLKGYIGINPDDWDKAADGQE